MVDGWQPLEEDDLQWKTTFSGRWPSVEDDLRWKTTCGGRWSAVEDDLQRKMTFAGSLHGAYSALRYFFLQRCNATCCYCSAQPTAKNQKRQDQAKLFRLKWKPNQTVLSLAVLNYSLLYNIVWLLHICMLSIITNRIVMHGGQG